MLCTQSEGSIEMQSSVMLSGYKRAKMLKTRGGYENILALGWGLRKALAAGGGFNEKDVEFSIISTHPLLAHIKCHVLKSNPLY